jgi:protocatechuate 3,4-dioxygenase beta subunit
MQPDIHSSFHLDDDDVPIGALVSRRDAVRLLAAGSAAMLVGCKPGPRNASAGASSSSVGTVASAANAPLPACVAKPELTVGPYFVDAKLNRSDIRIEPSTNAAMPGAPLELAFQVQQVSKGQCTPLPGAMVDVWQCDASGQYSGVNDRMVGFDTSSLKFLRGYQVTDASGVATFTTIYPGWYQGRAVHIHFKIRTPSQAAIAGQDDRIYEFTSQLFFDESLTDQVHAQQPYAAKGQGRLRNERDGIYQRAGDALKLNVALARNTYAAVFSVALDLSDAATGRIERSGGGPGGSGGPGGRPPRRPPG